ncbi:MAG: hypothetical protein K2O89_04005 [Clostridia bacterium]|nr:hypothetical protein [Clostridia bacterium]
MKALKKITAIAVAMTMSCSVLAFTACNPNGDGETEIGLPSGKPAQTLDASFVSALQNEKNYVSVNLTNKISGTERYYSKTGSVETTSDTTSYEINSVVNGKVDVQNGDADLVAKSVATYENDGGRDVSYQYSGNNFVSYAFLRDWNTFIYDTPDNKEVTDFTGKELNYGGSLKIDWEEILGQLSSVGGIMTLEAENIDVFPWLDVLPQTEDLIKQSLTGENYVLVQLAAAANTVKYENGVYSIDLIDTVDTVLTEVGSVIYALKGTNTVGEILNNDIVKKYLSVFTNAVPVDEVKNAVATGIDALDEIEKIKPLLPFFKNDLAAVKQITANDTYDYLVALISSENVLNIANNVASIAMQYEGNSATPMASISSDMQGALFTKTFDKYTVNEILSTVNGLLGIETPITLKLLQNTYKTYIATVCDGEKLQVATNPAETSALTEFSVEYKVEGEELISQKVNYAFEQEYVSGGVGTSTGNGIYTYYFYETKETQEGTLELVYETSAPALTDISDNPVSYTEVVWNEEDIYLFSVYDDLNDEYKDFYLGAWAENGEYLGFKVYDADYDLAACAESSFNFLLGSNTYSVEETSRYKGLEYECVELQVSVEGITLWRIQLNAKEVDKTSTVAEIIAKNA